MGVGFLIIIFGRRVDEAKRASRGGRQAGITVTMWGQRKREGDRQRNSIRGAVTRYKIQIKQKQRGL